MMGLERRAEEMAKNLPYGDQRRLEIARALATKLRLLLLDEPSMGLAPELVAQIFEIISEINQADTTILLVEQNAAMALQRAHREMETAPRPWSWRGRLRGGVRAGERRAFGSVRTFPECARALLGPSDPRTGRTSGTCYGSRGRQANSRPVSGQLCKIVAPQRIGVSAQVPPAAMEVDFFASADAAVPPGGTGSGASERLQRACPQPLHAPRLMVVRRC
jgi:hypothetical protein